MRIITGAVASTPLAWLSALSHIAPPSIRRQSALLTLYRKIISDQRIPRHHDLLTDTIVRLKSRNPSAVTAKTLHTNEFNVKEAWAENWLSSGVSSQLFDFDKHTNKSLELKLPRKLWCNLNRLRTRHGNCNEMLHKWGYARSPSCQCGNPNQSMNHLLFNCPIYKYEGDVNDLIILTDQALHWLSTLNL